MALNTQIKEFFVSNNLHNCQKFGLRRNHSNILCEIKSINLGFENNEYISYMTNREQYVIYGGSKSANMKINLGDHRILYWVQLCFNHCSHCFDGEVNALIYADDTSVVIKHNYLVDSKSKVKMA